MASKIKKAEEDLVQRLQSKADELVKSNDDAAQVNRGTKGDGDDDADADGESKHTSIDSHKHHHHHHP